MNSSFLVRDIASRLHHRGALICPEHADIAADLREISAIDLAALKAGLDARKIDILSSYGFNQPPPQTKPFAFSDGKAIIPIQGMLVNRMSWGSSYATGYNFIRAQMQAALDDPEVDAIIYDVNSSGGIAAGCGELAAEMFAARSSKPSLAVIDSRAYSAAYYLASAADRVVVTPSGGVGSIGCVAMHVDYSGMLDEAGIKVTMIHAGAEKVDGNPFQSLSARAKASIQQDVDYHYGMFTEAVAQHRDLPVDDIRATEAACYLPPEALDLGLIDAIETPAEAVANLSKAEGTGMTTQAQAGGAAAGSTAAPVTEQTKTPVMTAADVEAAASRAVTAALSAERTRQSGIRTCEEAKGRETLAAHLADNTEMTVDQAKGILAAAPKEAPADATGRQPASGFAAAMDRTPNPNVGADTGGGQAGAGGEDTPESRAGRILSALGRATGKMIELKPAAAA